MNLNSLHLSPVHKILNHQYVHVNSLGFCFLSCVFISSVFFRSFHPSSFFISSTFFLSTFSLLSRHPLFLYSVFPPIIFHLSNLCPYESFDKLVTRILVTKIHCKSILSLYFSSMFFLLYQSCYNEEMPCLPLVLMDGGLQWIFCGQKNNHGRWLLLLIIF